MTVMKIDVIIGFTNCHVQFRFKNTDQCLLRPSENFYAWQLRKTHLEMIIRLSTFWVKYVGAIFLFFKFDAPP